VNEEPTNDTSRVFRCDFIPEHGKLYTVTWYLNAMQIKHTDSLTEWNMADHYLHENVIGGPGAAVSFSTTYFDTDTLQLMPTMSIHLFVAILRKACN